MTIQLIEKAINEGLRYENGQVIGVRGFALTPRCKENGCYTVSVYSTHVSLPKLVYYLTTRDARAFDPEYEIHHIDGYRDNHSAGNLMVLKRFDKRSVKNTGEGNPSSKLTIGDVRAIRERYEEGNITYAELGKWYGVSSVQIGNIIRGDKWKDGNSEG